ncbi:hypothetical protein IPF86_03125 [Candidatus Nomurabacteria bacterium]|nr:MAG: hypothetical protein IPF86_03125 [Candidatus Nomurabacteria bacterium]
MKNSIKILTFVFVTLSFASCTKGSELFGIGGEVAPNTSPNGEWFYTHDYTGKISCAFSINQPAQFYVYISTSAPRPWGDTWNVNVWPLNASVLGLLQSSISNNPWPVFTVRLSDDGSQPIQAMQMAYDQAKAAGAAGAYVLGFVTPFEDSADNNTVKLRVSPGTWTPLFPH